MKCIDLIGPWNPNTETSGILIANPLATNFLKSLQCIRINSALEVTSTFSDDLIFTSPLCGKGGYRLSETGHKYCYYGKNHG